MDLIVFQEKLERSKARFLAFWSGASPAPEWGPEIAHRDKLARERRIEQRLCQVKRLLRRYPSSSARPKGWREDFLTLLRASARDCVEFPDSSLHPLFSTEAMEATRQFTRDAREFEPAISDASLTQALRNLWVAHSLQALFGVEIGLSPAIFAYSMQSPR